MHIPCISYKFKLYIQKISIGYTLYMIWILHVYYVYILVTWLYPYETRKYCWQVKDTEHCLHHKLFPANAWMKIFHCTLRPIGTVAGSINRSDEDIPLDLIFFSPFEVLRLRTAGVTGIESKGIHRVYEPSPVPTLYVGRVEDLLGQVPLIACFLDGNTTSTIPHKRQKDAFECRCQWCCPNLAEGQPCLRDQHLVVELWTAPASLGRPLCGQNWEAPTEVLVWGSQARMGN